MDIIQFLYYIGEIALSQAVAGLVGMIVEVSNAVADGYPGKRSMRLDKGGEDKDSQRTGKNLLHSDNFIKNIW
jgi:hypothetical protein